MRPRAGGLGPPGAVPPTAPSEPAGGPAAPWGRSLRRVLGGALNVLVARVMNVRGQRAPVSPLPLERYRALAAPAPLDTVRLLAGRANAERARVLEAVLRGRALPYARLPFRTVEGGGVSFVAEVGSGPPVLLLAAHHDAVPGSPGANDNAAAVAILLDLATRLTRDPPRRLAVRLAFFGAEERGMLGSRVYARRVAPGELIGVVSLELCGIGDSLALWDVTPTLEESRLVRTWTAAVRALGYRRDETYHLAAPVPFFGSDHRPFADRGVAAVGLTAVPAAAAEALRAFIYGGVRGILVPPGRRPPPFTTYHTSGDRPETLEPATLDRVGAALEALCRQLDAGRPP